jgi:hypothetical protein
MLVQIPPLSFTNVVPEPNTIGLLYVWTTRQDPEKLYITQSIPRLAREVLYRIYDSSINISSLYRSLTLPTKRRRRRMWYELKVVNLEELNELVSKSGANVVTGHPELWEFDMSSLRT